MESQLNRGTRFIVTIYLKFAGEEDTGERSLNGNVPKTPAPFPPGTCVLLAEDNELNREIVVELLSMFNITAVCAVNGREAVERFEADTPGTYALILMDIQMPVMDGYTAASAIRSLGKTGRRPDGTGIPIIALTANAFADDVYRAKQAGMDEHVTKPLEISRLLEIMHRYLGGPGRNRTE